jgi:hypothetical protein
MRIDSQRQTLRRRRSPWPSLSTLVFLWNSIDFVCVFHISQRRRRSLKASENIESSPSTVGHFNERARLSESQRTPAFWAHLPSCAVVHAHD